MALITVEQATERVPNFPSSDLALMTEIVDACSALIERYCNRTFAVTSYDELLDGTGHNNLILNNYPVVTIDRVMFQPTQVISIGNTSSAVSRASFRLDSTNLYLTSVASGVTTNRTITRASCLTFGDLAAAINAYSADGWTSTALGMYSSWSTADLYAPQGGYEVRWIGWGYLTHHAFGVPAAMQNTTIGEIVSNFGFQRGYQNYRAIYSAGYTTIPDEIQQACAELCDAVYLNVSVNPNLQSENLGGYSYANIAEKSFANLSIASRYAVDQYRVRRVVKYKTC